MNTFILDFGSGNTCRNDPDTIRRMIDAFYEAQRRVEIEQEEGQSQKGFVIKWQLFIEAGENIPLTHESFDLAYNHARGLGLRTTASVFDEPSLGFLMQYEIPFVKIANRKDLWGLAAKVPNDMRLIQSVSSQEEAAQFLEESAGREAYLLACVSKYPAKANAYKNQFPPALLYAGISDHTQTWALLKKYDPTFYEVHYKLPDSKGLDAGPFARTPKQLKELFYG